MTNSKKNKTGKTITFKEVFRSKTFKSSIFMFVVGILIVFCSALFSGPMRIVINFAGCVMAAASMNPIMKYISTGKEEIHNKKPGEKGQRSLKNN